MFSTVGFSGQVVKMYINKAILSSVKPYPIYIPSYKVLGIVPYSIYNIEIIQAFQA